MESQQTPPTAARALVARARHAVRSAGEADRRATVEQIADAVGCMAAGASHPLAGRLTRLVGDIGGRGEARSRALPDLTGDLAAVVTVDATLCHVDEFDGVHAASGTVPSGAVVPAALAVAEGVGVSGRMLVDAVLAGYEVMVEAALRHGGPRLYARSWWPTLVVGPLGSAMATAVILGLDDTETEKALGLAAIGAGGLLSDDVFGDAHYFQLGEAAARGVRAAYAARAGFSCSDSVLDAPFGRAFGTAEHPPAPSTRPHIAACIHKTYPCAMPFQPVAQALTSWRASIDHAAIASVHVGVTEPMLGFVTADTRVAGPPEAAASAAYVVSGALLGQATDPAFFRSHNPETLLPFVVTVGADPGAENLGAGRLTATIELTFKDGGRQRRVASFSTTTHADPSKYAANLALAGRPGPAWDELLELDVAGVPALNRKVAV